MIWVNIVVLAGLALITAWYAKSTHKMAKTMEKEQRAKYMPFLYPKSNGFLINVGDGFAKGLIVRVNNRNSEELKRYTWIPKSLHESAEKLKLGGLITRGMPIPVEKKAKVTLSYKDIFDNEYRTKFKADEEGHIDYATLQFEMG